MCWSNKQPSTSELNSDSFSSSRIVKSSRRKNDKTIWSCGFASSLETVSKTSYSPSGVATGFIANAGLGAGVFLFRTSHRVLSGRAMFRRAAAARGSTRTEFISVSGFRADRSALRSDLRLKRTSGPVAATGHPYAPMNSPLHHLFCEQRVSFSTFRLTS